MKNENTIIPIIGQEPELKAATGKRYVRSLEYEVIANLAMKQFVQEKEINFEGLLSIPLTERIPGLINDYGLKRAHRLIKLVLQEFCYSIPLPKSAKLSDTKIAACACDLILAAYEDQLSLEDLIVFFERAKEGAWGKFRGTLTHFSIMQKLEQYRTERSVTYRKLKDEQEAQLKKMSVIPRIGETKSIGEILQQAEVIPMTQRKSG
ncbi:MAG: hypothetical protein EOO14_08635 [Chitinophagaceae bacterium]|nr:MAG: hypothetical protein EOO14_08635 [Chitinophagaceae bacterium]